MGTIRSILSNFELPLSSAATQIIPLLTKIKPNQENIDLEIIQNDLNQMCQNELKNQIVRQGIDYQEVNNEERHDLEMWRENKKFTDAFC